MIPVAEPEIEGIHLAVRPEDSIFQAAGAIDGGMFHGRWHFSFDDYSDPEHDHFGNLKALNDETLDPGATLPLHPHCQDEVVTYVVGGEFRHEDEYGKGEIIHQGGVQHTTVGWGMYHGEINNRNDIPMRFIQIWYMPERLNLSPSVEHREVERSARTDRWLPLVSAGLPGTLPLRADGSVYSSYLRSGQSVDMAVAPGRGLYLYVLEGGPVAASGQQLRALDAVEATGAGTLSVRATDDAELILLDVNLSEGRPTA